MAPKSVSDRWMRPEWILTRIHSAQATNHPANSSDPQLMVNDPVNGALNGAWNDALNGVWNGAWNDALAQPGSGLVPRAALERAKGIEPSTYSLGSCHSTTELRPLGARPALAGGPAAGGRDRAERRARREGLSGDRQAPAFRGDQSSAPPRPISDRTDPLPRLGPFRRSPEELSAGAARD